MGFFVKKRFLYYGIGVTLSLPAVGYGVPPLLLAFVYGVGSEGVLRKIYDYYLFRRQEYQTLYKHRDKLNYLDGSVEGAWDTKRHLMWYAVAYYTAFLYGILTDTLLPFLVIVSVGCGIQYLFFAPKLVNRGELQDQRRFYDDIAHEEREQKIVETIVGELDKKRSSHTSVNQSFRRPAPPYQNRQRDL